MNNFCLACGKASNPNTRFCVHCGTAAKAVSTDSQRSTAMMPTSASTPTPGTVTAGRSGQRSLLIAGAGVLALVLLIAVGSAALKSGRVAKSAATSEGGNSTASLSGLSTPEIGTKLSSELPTTIGNCANTTIESVENRIDGDSESGSAVKFKNGGYQVGYDIDPAIQESINGDPVRMCLLSIETNCQPEDAGRSYRTTNLRTHKTWERGDSSHQCHGSSPKDQ
jgi:hypothetical protein